MGDKLLTRREAELVGLLTEGCTLREAAKRMTVEYSTVVMHSQNARGKVGVETSRQLAIWAVHHRPQWEREE